MAWRAPEPREPFCPGTAVHDPMALPSVQDRGVRRSPELVPIMFGAPASIPWEQRSLTRKSNRKENSSNHPAPYRSLSCPTPSCSVLLSR